jgi:phage terminase large subunit-like protein
LQHIKGRKAREPFKLEPWQRVIVRRIFGWKHPDGTRVYRSVYVEVPRKNGKSTLAAGIALYLLFCDGEEGAEVYSAALDKDQAGIVYSVAAEMTARCPMLDDRSECLKGVKQINVPLTASFYKPIPADDDGAHGFNAHGVICDELHTQPNRHLVDVLTTSMASRDQPLALFLTTAGSDRSSICWEYHQKALDILAARTEDPEFLAVVYGAAPEDDWKDLATWKKANPNFGVSVSERYLRSECEKAQKNPALENTFRRLHLNQWTEQETRIIPMDAWRLRADRELSANRFLGCDCRVGVDLASTRDIVAAVKVFYERTADGKRRVVWIPRFWMPRDSVSKRTEQDKARAMNFAERGLITLTPGNEVDYFAIAEELRAEWQLYRLLQIGFDPWNASMLIQHLVNLGLPAEAMIKLPQSFATYNEPFKALLGGLESGTFAHPGNEVLDWMAENTAARVDPSGNIRPDKAKSGEKIDGITGGLMGWALWIASEVQKKDVPSVYEQRGIRSLSRQPAEPESPRGDSEDDLFFDGHDSGPVRRSVEWEDFELTHNG